jgi:hypothetical protein
MTITLKVAVPLFFQLIAGSVCRQAQVIQPGVNFCYDIQPSAMNPEGVDSQALDMIAGQYMTTKWLTSSTMLSRVESLDGSCYSWLNDDWQATTTCDFDTNP